MGTEKLKRHIPPEYDQIPTEFMQLGGRIACSGNQKLSILYGTTKHYLCTGMSRSLCLFIRQVIKQMVLIVKAHHCYHKHTNFFEYLLSNLTACASYVNKITGGWIAT
jgi:hypothetical protein